jgi:hypothetical protein
VRLQVDASGEIIELTTSCPWKAHLFQLEEEMSTGEAGTDGEMLAVQLPFPPVPGVQRKNP